MAVYVKPGAALADMRGRHWHYCAEPSCGKRFSGIKTAKFCSNACRQKAKYARAKQLPHPQRTEEK